jgi:hypothetical protein
MVEDDINQMFPSNKVSDSPQLQVLTFTPFPAVSCRCGTRLLGPGSFARRPLFPPPKKLP